jgi:hypothetical protein
MRSGKWVYLNIADIILGIYVKIQATQADIKRAFKNIAL